MVVGSTSRSPCLPSIATSARSTISFLRPQSLEVTAVPVDLPARVAVRAHLAPHVRFQDVREAVESVVANELQRVPAFCRGLAEGRIAAASPIGRVMTA